MDAYGLVSWRTTSISVSRSLASATSSTANSCAGRCRSSTSVTSWRNWFGSIASNSTLSVSPNRFALLSLCLVGRVGRSQAAIWSGFTALERDIRGRRQIAQRLLDFLARVHTGRIEVAAVVDERGDFEFVPFLISSIMCLCRISCTRRFIAATGRRSRERASRAV